MKVPTASVYCSRKRASAMASRNARWPMFSVYHDGLGNDPVIVVGSVMVSVGLVMFLSDVLLGPVEELDQLFRLLTLLVRLRRRRRRARDSSCGRSIHERPLDTSERQTWLRLAWLERD